MSYLVQVQTGVDGWLQNALRFSTKEAAEKYARELQTRWTLVTKWQVLESADPPNRNGEAHGPS